MIDNKRHAYEILEFVMGRKADKELIDIVKSITLQSENSAIKIDETKLWEKIILQSEGLSFISKRKITTLDELILAHYEWKMKYEWGIYKNISSSIDYPVDELDSAYYLD